MPLKDFNSAVMIETAVPIIVTSRVMTKVPQKRLAISRQGWRVLAISHN
jgi:hypothetical protein